MIWRKLRNVRVGGETAYVADNPLEMLVKYLRGTLQAHRVMDDFLWMQLRQHLEMTPHITLYLLEHRAPWVGVLDLRHRVEAQ